MSDPGRLEHLRAMLKELNSDRFDAAIQLAELGHADEAVIEVLCGMLGSDAYNEKATATRVLNSLGSQVDGYLESWLGGSAGYNNAKLAAYTLYRLSSWTPEEAPLLMEALSYLGAYEREQVIKVLRDQELPPETFAGLAFEILEQFGDHLPAAVVSDIVALLGAENEEKDMANEEYRMAVIQLVGKIGPKAREAVPTLTAALRGDSLDILQRWKVPKALASILGAAAVPVLTEVLLDSDGFFRRESDDFTCKYAADALGQIGPAAKAAVPALVMALRDPAESVRKAAAAALEAIDPDAAAAAGIL